MSDRLDDRHRQGLLATSDRLRIHSGCVFVDDGGVLLIGPSGAGKSTLVARLGVCGWTVLADDWIALDPPQTAIGFSLPIAVNFDSLVALGLEPGAMPLAPDGKFLLHAARHEGAPMTTDIRVVGVIRDSLPRSVRAGSVLGLAHEVCAQWMVDPAVHGDALVQTAGLLARCHIVEIDRSDPEGVNRSLRELLATPVRAREVLVKQRTSFDRPSSAYTGCERLIGLAPGTQVVEVDEASMLHRLWTDPVVVVGGAAHVLLREMGLDMCDKAGLIGRLAQVADVPLEDVRRDAESVLVELSSWGLVVGA